MLKEFFTKAVEDAVIEAMNNDELGQMEEFHRGSLSGEKPKNSDFGDFAVNVSSLARFAHMSPLQIAEAVSAKINIDDCDITVVGGFINFKVGEKFLKDTVSEILSKKADYGKAIPEKPEKILLEYVSANPTGPFHIGHGR